MFDDSLENVAIEAAHVGDFVFTASAATPPLPLA